MISGELILICMCHYWRALLIQQRFRVNDLSYYGRKQAERALDKSRGEYELEQRTDFGVALVGTSRVRYLLYKNKVDQVMAWMELMMLLGDEPVSIFNLDETR